MADQPATLKDWQRAAAKSAAASALTQRPNKK